MHKNFTGLAQKLLPITFYNLAPFRTPAGLKLSSPPPFNNIYQQFPSDLDPFSVVDLDIL